MVALLVRVILRLFYRRITYVGVEHVPPTAPVLFVLNHPNALVDPLFVLDAVHRPIHFLAKAPLFTVPVFGRVLRACGGLPVFRRQDGADTRLNEETFRECYRVLARGESVAIFPEGTTHSDAGLRPLKTGAARIALGAEGHAHFGLALHVLPVGLQYEAKETFRSDVTAWFGAPHQVADLAEMYATAPSEAVAEETKRLGAALWDVTLHVERHELAELIAATAIFSSSQRWSDEETAVLRRQFLDGYSWFRSAMPDRLSRVRRALGRHAAVLRHLGLTIDDVRAGREPSAVGLMLRAVAIFPILVLAGVAVLSEWLPYKAVDVVARRKTGAEPELTATAKVLAALVFYPLWWVATALAVRHIMSWQAALGLLIAHPVVALLGMTAMERLDQFRRRLQVFRLSVRRHRLERLRRYEGVIREELRTLAAIYQSTNTPAR